MSRPAQVISYATTEVTLTVNAVSDVGAKRAVNEDSYLARAPIFLVADGMGGHAYGDRASQAVVRTFSASIPADQVTTAAAVLAAITESNTAVRALTDGLAEDRQISGTTVSGIALIGSEGQSNLHWMVFNVGDSRVYSWDGRLTQLTVDHSAVQELIDDGSISEAEASHHPERNVITRAVGIGDEVEADIWLLPAGGKQTFLICSDGLTKELTDDLISTMVSDAVASKTMAALAPRLVESAIREGGLDNITVIIIEASVVQIAEAGHGALHSVEVPAFLEQTLPRV